jgi:hypothetical protein
MTVAWRPEPDKGQSFLKKKMVDGRPNDRHVEGVLDKLLVQAPKRAPQE